MNPTKIEWCDFTWNPVVGCAHDCEYCYARRIHERFNLQLHPFDEPQLYEYRLDQPAKRKKPARIFVVSMGDLFGEWVPDEWIEQVFKACEAAPQHTYYFLTKNYARFFLRGHYRHIPWAESMKKNNWWIGHSITGVNQDGHGWCQLPGVNEFISMEPLLDWPIQIGKYADYADGVKTKPNWLIVGSETRNGRPVNMPKREWILDIRKQCADLSIPLFEKNSLAPLDLPDGLIQEWPKSKGE